MFGNEHFDGLRKSFADQFGPDGEGFVYRKHLTGPAIPVSAAERDRFVAAFSRRMRLLFCGVLLVTLVLIGALVAIVVVLDGELSDLWIYAIVAAPGVLLAALTLRAWNAPSRELATRGAVQPALSRNQASVEAIDRVTWGQLLGSLAVVAFGLWQLHRKYDLLHGWDRLWLVAGGVAVAATIVQAYRKWRRRRH